MKVKRTAKIILMTLVITFLILYISCSTGYYEVENNKKAKLTDDALKRYEQDVKAGKKIDLDSYIPEDKSYVNNVVKLTSGVSRGIEKSMNTVMKYIFKEMEKAVKENNN